MQLFHLLYDLKNAICPEVILRYSRWRYSLQKSWLQPDIKPKEEAAAEVQEVLPADVKFN